MDFGYFPSNSFSITLCTVNITALSTYQLGSRITSSFSYVLLLFKEPFQVDWCQHFHPEDFYNTFTDVWQRLQIYAVTCSPVWVHIHHNDQLLSGQLASLPGLLINVWCQGVPPNAGNTSIICETPVKLCDKKKQK